MISCRLISKLPETGGREVRKLPTRAVLIPRLIGSCIRSPRGHKTSVSKQTTRKPRFYRRKKFTLTG
nr:MAG TPA: hypothetical protein [Caudoviricetes sp.]